MKLVPIQTIPVSFSSAFPLVLKAQKLLELWECNCLSTSFHLLIDNVWSFLKLRLFLLLVASGNRLLNAKDNMTVQILNYNISKKKRSGSGSHNQLKFTLNLFRENKHSHLSTWYRCHVWQLIWISRSMMALEYKQNNKTKVKNHLHLSGDNCHKCFYSEDENYIGKN